MHHQLTGSQSVSGCSSVGRAPPCQGGCHEFEPRQPLQFSKEKIQRNTTQFVVKNGGLAEWLCSGLQIRGPRFDSGTRLHSARVVELVDTRDLKSLAGNSVPVQVRPRVPFHTIGCIVWDLALVCAT